MQSCDPHAWYVDVLITNLLAFLSDESSLRPVFGCPLEEHLKAQNRSIAFVLEESLTYLHETALEEQVFKCRVKKTNYFFICHILIFSILKVKNLQHCIVCHTGLI